MNPKETKISGRKRLKIVFLAYVQNRLCNGHIK